MTASKDKIDTTTYQYDGNGRLIEEKNTHEITTYTYDGANNLLSRNTTRDGSIVAKFEYTYNEVNDVVTESITLDTTTTTKAYVYDKNRQLTHTKEKTKEHETEYLYTYDNLGNKTSTIKTVDGKREETQYTLQNGQVIGTRGSENTQITRDNAGNVSQKISESGKVETFAYNSEGKLIGLTDNTGKSVVYTYDGFGNRTDKVTTIKLKENQDIRIQAVHNNLANHQYSGKLDKAQAKEKLETLKETLEAKVASGINTCPTKVEGGSKSVDQNHFVNDINREHTEVLQVQNNKNEAIQTLIYGAAGKQKLLYNQSDIAYNLVKDAKQSVYGFTSGNQTASNLTKEVFAQDGDKENDNHHVALKQDYTAYGQAKRSMLEETPQFNGEMLSSGNLTYMRARNYDSTIGQFTSKDTWLGRQTNPLSQNRNTFVENNPVNYIDPSGHRVSGNGMYLCSDDGDRNCSIANNTQRIIYDSNAQVSYEDAQYRAVNRYANQPHIMNDWFQNNRPSSKYQKLQNLANYAQQAAIAAEQKAKAEMNTKLQELYNINPEAKRIFLEKYQNAGLSDYNKMMILQKYIQVCQAAEQKAKAEWEAKPWYEKVDWGNIGKNILIGTLNHLPQILGTVVTGVGIITMALGAIGGGGATLLSGGIAGPVAIPAGLEMILGGAAMTAAGVQMMSSAPGKTEYKNTEKERPKTETPEADLNKVDADEAVDRAVSDKNFTDQKNYYKNGERTGGLKNYESVKKGYNQAKKDFDSMNLKNVRTVKTDQGTMTVGDLQDGSGTVGLRTFAKTESEATLQIDRVGIDKIKIRY